MSWFPRFVNPWALLLLALVPWAIWVGIHIRSLSAGRKWLAVALRTIILLCLIGALAGAEVVRVRDRLAVFFIIDESDSIPEATQSAAADLVREMVGEHMGAKDEAGLIIAGETPSIEHNVEETLEFEEIHALVGGQQTDLASAVRVALAAFPQGYMRRIVLLSDGNETTGSVLEEAKAANANGAAVDVVPIAIGGDQEVRIREVKAPTRANADEPFRVGVVVASEQDCEARLSLYQRVRGGRRLLSSEIVTLQEGDNAFSISQELAGAGFYEYEAEIETAADSILANNEGRAFTLVRGQPTVLYVEADPEHSQELRAAIEAEGLQVDQVAPEAMPQDLSGLLDYDAIALSNVSAARLGMDRMRAIEAAVRDFGIGLVMIGGPESYGAGGYLDTPVERALPASMDIKQRRVLPKGALAVILHTCEMPGGNTLGREVALAALNVLSSQDLMGALAYGGRGDYWIYELRPVGTKAMMRERLKTASLGDMPDADPTLRMAFKGLNAASAAVKRVVMISDGDPGPPTPQLLGRFKNANIPVSTVCIGPHAPNSQDMMRWIAGSTGGQYYFVSNPQALPQIFMKEAMVVRRGLLIEERFTPRMLHDSELIRGFADQGFPPLDGYVAATAKDAATVPLVSHEDDPLLAHWRYGLGKSVAYTSDVTSRWASQWIGWAGFSRFWAQTVRWATRELSPGSFRVETSTEGERGRIRIDAVDDQGNFINFLRPRGVVIGPPPGFERREVELIQTGPGIYEGDFPAADKGVYMVNLLYEDEQGEPAGMIPAGLAVNYSREYAYASENLPLLERVAEAGGGRLLRPEDDPFTHDLAYSSTVAPIWQHLAVLAACMFPIEIFVRRVVFSPAAALAPVAAAMRRVPGLRRLAPKRKVGRPTVTGLYGESARAAREGGKPRFEDVEVSGATREAFGGAEEGGPAEGGPEQATPAEEAPPKERSAYTSRLLEAKQRALKQRGHGKSEEETESNEEETDER